MILAYKTSEKIRSANSEAFALYEKSCFGEKKDSVIEYTPIESLYLILENKMQLTTGKKMLQFEDLIKKFKRTDKKIETKFIVYKDLRKRGYIVKTALKFGAEFRVYEKGIRPGQDHARWILYTTKENEIISWQDFAAKNRVAHSTKKKLILAIVDDETDVSYYEVSWFRP